VQILAAKLLEWLASWKLVQCPVTGDMVVTEALTKALERLILEYVLPGYMSCKCGLPTVRVR
jgi:hypothetical protein